MQGWRLGGVEAAVQHRQGQGRAPPQGRRQGRLRRQPLRQGGAGEEEERPRKPGMIMHHPVPPRDLCVASIKVEDSQHRSLTVYCSYYRCERV